MADTSYRIDVILYLQDKISANMTRVQSQLKKLQISVDKINKRQNNYNATVNKTTSSTKKLSAALLPIMFTGMALYRVFGGMTKSMLDLLGTTDMFSAAMTVVLLPALTPIADKLNDIASWMIDWDDTTKLLVGDTVVLVAILSGLMVLFSMIGLFIGGLSGLDVLVISLKWVGSIIGWLLLQISGLGVAFAAAPALFLSAFIAIGALLVGLWDAFKHNFGGIADSAQILVNNILGFFKNLFSGNFGGMWDNLKAGLGSFLNIVGQTVINTVRIVLVGLVSIADKALGLLGINKNYAGQLNDWITKNNRSQALSGSGNIPSFATGGVMPYTGLANLHAGETITPAGQSINSSPTINIQASISNDYDVRRLADQLSKYWVNDMERISKARGMV